LLLAAVIDPETQFVDAILLSLYGQNLDDVAKCNDPFNLSWLRSLLETAEYLNSISIVHEDICGRNLVVRGDQWAIALKDLEE
jgi:hypothetical protein